MSSSISQSQINQAAASNTNSQNVSAPSHPYEAPYSSFVNVPSPATAPVHRPNVVRVGGPRAGEQYISGRVYTQMHVFAMTSNGCGVGNCQLCGKSWYELVKPCSQVPEQGAPTASCVPELPSTHWLHTPHQFRKIDGRVVTPVCQRDGCNVTYWDLCKDPCTGRAVEQPSGGGALAASSSSANVTNTCCNTL